MGPEAAFDEEGHVVDRDRLDVQGGPQLAHPGRDGRPGDPVEIGQGGRVREDDGRERRTVEGPVRTDEVRPEPLGHGGQGRPPGFDDLASHDVGVDDLGAEFPQGGGHRGLTRPDPPGETDVEHLDRLEPSPTEDIMASRVVITGGGRGIGRATGRVLSHGLSPTV